MSFTANIDDVVAENRNHLLGKHPKWGRVRLKEVATILNGYPFESGRFKRSGGTPLIRIRDILDGNTKTFYDGAFDSTFVVKRGEILIGMDGDFHCEPWAGEPALLNQRVCKITPDESRFAKQFLRYLLPGYLSAINEQTPSVTVKHLSSRTIGEIPLPLPPLPEQRRIVAEIEKQFTRLEAGVTALRRVQANLKRYRAAVLKAACEGRLVPTEAALAKTGIRKATFETGEALLARILTERRQIHERSQAAATRKKKYKEPTTPTIPANEALPAGWTWATWDQLGFAQNGRPFPSAEYQETGFKLLRPGNLHVSGKVVWTESNTRCMPQKFAGENPDLIVRGSELVINLTAQSLKDEFLGRICITGGDDECLLNQRLARLTPVILLPEFVLYLLKAWRFRRYVDGLNSGSLIQHMFTSQLAEFTFPLPPLAEQTRIVAEVERRLSVVEELEAVVLFNLQRATRLRQSILQQAFTGQLAS